MERNCGDCGATDWAKMLESEYPEHRQERDRTVETVYKCRECGAQGKHFEYNNGDGSDNYSGALR